MNLNIKTNLINKDFINHLWSFLIGMSCGLPFILTSSTLKAWMSVSGVPIYVIGFMNIINFSYLLKFTWAPVFDRYQLPGWTQHKSWIIYSHFTLAAALFALAYTSPSKHLYVFAGCASITAFLGANATLSLDGYWIRFIDSQQVQSYASITEIGYRLGKIITGGIALIIADFFDWQILYQSASVFLFVLTLLLMFLPDISNTPSPHQLNKKSSYSSELKRSWESIYGYGGFALVFFLMTVKINEALEHNLMPNFLLEQMHLSLSTVGVITKIIGIMANLVGLTIAVKCIKTFNYKRSLSYAIMIHFASTLCMSFIAIHHVNDVQLMAFISFIDNISRGLIATTLLAFFAERLTKNHKSATQFSIFALITGVSGILFSPISGLIVYYFGWPSLFISSALATLPSFLILRTLSDELEVKVTANPPLADLAV
jgi:PAT family beta-lactamase induction signal transducer AmpG